MEARDRVIEECQRIGEQAVREKINDNVWNRQKRTYAEEWLDIQSRLRREASNSEHLAVARSAKNAAWAAAIAATLAAIATAAMAVIAYQSLSS